MSVPDFMPVLEAGSQQGAREGACVMEYVSILAGERFSDRPPCTSSTIAHVARITNDFLRDENRHLLVPLIHRLVNTRVAWVELKLISWTMAQQTRRNKYTSDSHPQNFFVEVMDQAREGKVDLLVGILDEFDRLTGRTAPPLTEADQARLLAAVG